MNRLKVRKEGGSVVTFFGVKITQGRTIPNLYWWRSPAKVKAMAIDRGFELAGKRQR